MRRQSVRPVLVATIAAVTIAACGITLDVAPGNDADGGASSSSTSGATASSGSSSSGAGSSGSSSGDAATSSSSSSGNASSSSSSGNTSSSSSGAVVDACTLLDQRAVCAGKCGTLDDGCQGTFDCGGCGANPLFSCDDHVCACHPAGNVCNFACGPDVPDGCNGTVDCPLACPTGQTCGAVLPHVCGCKDAPDSMTCNSKPDGTHKVCGMVQNNCGHDVDCGDVCNPGTCQDCAGDTKCCR